MPLRILTGNLITMSTDAIVNAANSELLEGGGVCGAIFSSTHREKLTEACRQVAPCPTGKAVITPSFGLKSPHIIHAVGPIWKDGSHDEKELLERAYLSALELAYEKDLHSIAFPLLSCGIYGYPKEEGMTVAISTILTFLEHHEMEVYLVLLEEDLTEMATNIQLEIKKERS